MTVGYRADCPICGASLSVVALGPDHAPWLCRGCRRGWWVAELMPAAHFFFRPDHRDFGHGGVDVRRAIAEEWQAAHRRRTSLRPDQLGLVSAAVLEVVAPTAATDFAAHLRLALARQSGDAP